ncbi:hypothetical protein [Sphingosinicella sp. CPCC 101087]|uniref:hypothetical protein n=1 Tax=Sphingosinicella sp. CPCC 101087 TaxID=2497754 RepID=UPI00101DBEE7|nr:hypothetical protein [Sphingosinicella sp. CPCC 101087]
MSGHPAAATGRHDTVHVEEHGSLTQVTFRLAEGATLLSVGGRPTLHSALGEKLYALDPVTAFLARKLGTGASFAGLAGALVADGLSLDQAGRYVRRLLRQWSALGIAAAYLPKARLGARRPQALRIASLDAVLHFASAGVEARVLRAFAHLASGAPAASPRLSIEAFETNGLALVRCNGGGAAIVSRYEVAPLIKGLLTEHVLSLAPPDIAVHAACLSRGDRALLLTGSPGAGKTTLAVALSLAGFALASDDITLLDPAGRALGVAFAPAVKSGSWPLLSRLRPDLPEESVHLRSDGVRVRYLPPLAPIQAAGLEIGWIVNLRRTPGVGAGLEPLDPAGTLACLVGEAHSAAGAASLETLRMLIGVAEQARGFDLVYSDLDDGVRTLAAACA